jgi:5-methylcytosine-specific restriction protein A
MRAVADIATPETDEGLKQQAEHCTVRELADVARTMAQVAASHSPDPSRSADDRRFVRFNDTFHTMTAQFPPATYAEVRTTLEAAAHDVPTDGGTPWDQRVCDALTGIVSGSNASAASPGSKSPTFVVVHVPLDALVDDSVESTALAGELERDGLIDFETVQRMACDATIAVAVDDDAGHTMYEGRNRRCPTDAQRREVMRRDRHCRFPGCTNVTFTNVHHVVPWEPGGRTDLDNLALMCLHHHRVVHTNGWTMSGNPNEELQFLGPTGRAMTSRPSPLWARITAARSASAAAAP